MLSEQQTSAQCLLVEITTATKSKFYNNYMIVDSMIQSKTVSFLQEVCSLLQRHPVHSLRMQ